VIIAAAAVDLLVLTIIRFVGMSAFVCLRNNSEVQGAGLI
jgi:hypothetical protein